MEKNSVICGNIFKFFMGKFCLFFWTEVTFFGIEFNDHDGQRPLSIELRY